MISDTQLDEAIAEANRFLRMANALKKVRKNPGTARRYGDKEYTFRPSEVKEHAACKRSSMDLSRSLSTLRKGEP